MNKYIVGLSVGGIMEDPKIRIENVQVVQAENERGAENQYNLINNCNYYYGKCIGLYNDLTLSLLKNMEIYVDENVQERYICLSGSYFNASPASYQLRRAKDYLEEENATESNKEKELDKLYWHLKNKSLSELNTIQKNIESLNEIMGFETEVDRTKNIQKVYDYYFKKSITKDENCVFAKGVITGIGICNNNENLKKHLKSIKLEVE